MATTIIKNNLKDGVLVNATHFANIDANFEAVLKSVDKQSKTISISNGNLNLTTDNYQIASVSSDVTIVLPTSTSPYDIILELKPTANIAITLPSGVKWQGEAPTITSGNIYELHIGYDGTDTIGGFIEYA